MFIWINHKQENNLLSDTICMQSKNFRMPWAEAGLKNLSAFANASTNKNTN